MKYDMRYLIYMLRVAVALLALGFSGSARAQLLTADEFFHGGAQRFLTNNIPGALEVVTNGLQRFPADEKLQKLYELLNQQQQQNQQNQNQEQQKNQQQDEQSEDQPKDQDKKTETDQPKPPEDHKQQQQSKSDAAEQPEEKAGQNQPAAVNQMTPEEAKQLLDAQKGEEQVLIFQPKSEPKDRRKQLKDW